MGAYFGQVVVILLHIWSTIQKSPPLPAKKINSSLMRTEIKIGKENGSSHEHETRRVSETKFLLARRRRRKLFSWKLRNLILSVMQITTWFIKKVRLNTYFEEKNNHQTTRNSNHCILTIISQAQPAKVEQNLSPEYFGSPLVACNMTPNERESSSA